MLTFISRIDGFHVVDLMTEQHSYSIQSFLSQILEPLLLGVFPDVRKPRPHRLSLHLDKGRVHRSKASENFFAEILLFEYPIHLPVPSWHLLTSGSSGT
jgi:hypothetical protein